MSGIATSAEGAAAGGAAAGGAATFPGTAACASSPLVLPSTRLPLDRVPVSGRCVHHCAMSMFGSLSRRPKWVPMRALPPPLTAWGSHMPAPSSCLKSVSALMKAGEDTTARGGWSTSVAGNRWASCVQAAATSGSSGAAGMSAARLPRGGFAARPGGGEAGPAGWRDRGFFSAADVTAARNRNGRSVSAWPSGLS